jgi:hypothetical protein
MNKLVIGSLLVLLALAAAVLYSANQHKTTHIIISGTILTVELAETPPAQERGLSDRSSLPEDHGMLFVFDRQDYWGFWMIDMRFHLDIIWFDFNRQVVFIEPNLSPCTPQNCPVFTPNAKALYVLEVNAGFVEAHQVTYGTSFAFLGL